MDEEKDIFNDIDDDFLEEKPSRTGLRIISLILIISLIVVFIMPQIIYNMSFIQLLFGENIPRDEVANMLNNFESNYLHSEIFNAEEYFVKKQELLKSRTISQVEFQNFIKNVTDGTGDDYTYFMKLDKSEINPDSQIEVRNVLEDFEYIRIRRFSSGVSNVIDKQLSQMTKPNLIVDLRDNPGGDLIELIKILELFIPEGLEALRLQKNDKQQLYLTQNPQKYDFKNIYILLNKNSASASEVFALSMDMNKENVYLIGNDTAGKSVVQVETSGNDKNYRFMIVTHHWFIDKKSAPDLRYKLSEIDEEFNSLEDYLDYIKKLN